MQIQHKSLIFMVLLIWFSVKSEDNTIDDMTQFLLNGMAFEFSNYHILIDIKDMLSIHEYLTKKCNVKTILKFLKPVFFRCC